jgi:hypothetical protein
MPFSRYPTADSSLMEAMRAAFYRVCEELQLSCDREDPLTEVVFTRIVELAKAGERDPEVLCSKVLADLEMPASGVTQAGNGLRACNTLANPRWTTRKSPQKVGKRRSLDGIGSAHCIRGLP